jgi:hypothetical protein
MYLVQPPLIDGEDVLLQCTSGECSFMQPWDPDQLAIMAHDSAQPVCPGCGQADDLPPLSRVPWREHGAAA